MNRAVFVLLAQMGSRVWATSIRCRIYLPTVPLSYSVLDQHPQIIQQRMATQLPVEVAGDMTTHVATLDDLRALAMTNRVWYAATAPTLWRQITLDGSLVDFPGDPDHQRKPLLELFEANPALAGYVREVHVALAATTAEAAAAVFRNLRNVRALRVTEDLGFVWPEELDEFFELIEGMPTLEELSTLKLELGGAGASILLRIITLAPNLRDIVIRPMHTVRVHKPIDERQWPLLPSLKTLCMTVEDECFDFMSLLVAKAPNLQHLEISSEPWPYRFHNLPETALSRLRSSKSLISLFIGDADSGNALFDGRPESFPNVVTVGALRVSVQYQGLL